MTDLLPCPFCGSTNIDSEGWTSLPEYEGKPEYRSGPACDDCAASAGSVGEWNTRVTSARIAALEGALKGMVLVCGRTGDAFYDFEEQAEAFYQETGYMRPGKSVPMEMTRDDEDERRAKYSAWVKTKLDAGRAALASTEAMKGE